MPPIDNYAIPIARKAVPAGNVRGHRIPGKVQGARESHNGTMIALDIVHGKKKAPKKGEKNGPFSYDDRPTSSVVISKKHAHKFPVGKRVHVMLAAAPESGDDGDEMGE